MRLKGKCKCQIFKNWKHGIDSSRKGSLIQSLYSYNDLKTD